MVQALIVLLGLSALLDVALGAWAGVAWRSFAERWFANNPSMALDDPRLLGFVLAFFLLLAAVLQGLALFWIKREKPQGFTLATFFGGYLVVSSLATFAVFHRPEFLLIDGLRGALLVITSLFGANEPSTVRSLRLPASRGEGTESRPPREERHRRGHDQRRDMRREGRSERGSRGDRRGDRDRDRGRGGKGRRPAGGDARSDRGRSVPAAVVEPPRGKALEAEAEAKRSLAVVVKGDFKTRPPGAEGESAESSDDRKRRRRRRRRGGADGEEETPMVVPSAEIALAGDAEPTSRRGSSTRGRRGGQGRRRDRGGEPREGGEQPRDPRPAEASPSSEAPRPVPAAEPMSSAPAAAKADAGGSREVFGLTRQAVPFQAEAESAASGEDLYGRTRRPERTRRPALASREPATRDPIGPVASGSDRDAGSGGSDRATRGEPDTPGSDSDS